MTTGLVFEMKGKGQALRVEKSDEYRTAFQSLMKGNLSKQFPWLHPVREKAIQSFLETGFPTLRDEDWKYTSVEAISKSSFRFEFQPSSSEIDFKKIEPFLFANPHSPRLVFVNGFFCKELSVIPDAFHRLKIGNWASQPQETSESLRRELGRWVDYTRNGFTALNMAFMTDGVRIDLPKGTTLNEPLEVLHVIDSREALAIHPRNLIVLNEGSRASIIETFVTLEGPGVLSNSVSEIVLEKGSALDYYLIQRQNPLDFHINTTKVIAKQSSSLKSFYLTLGGKLVRNDLDVILAEEEAGCELRGLYLTEPSAHVDNHTLIDHARPNGKSHQIYKGIMNGKSRAVFNGKVFVRKDAQKTDAYQINKNLLLSEGAIVDTKPQLEIFADDVKCAHGAAIGQLDPEAVFYLKSRGLSEEASRSLLTYAFASEVIQKVEIDAVRERFDRWLWEWLENAAKT
ncbi:MAG TPA: Fe-S cluster assembly protein SufD [bacterium]|nr:Fe-S cluster assembly protein SufD [bacterium]